MPRLFVPPDQLGDDQVSLDGEPHRYLSRVLRLHPGDQVTVFDGAGTEIAASIVSSDAQRTVLQLGARQVAPPIEKPVRLLQAIPKGERMDLLVQKTTELGVARICPVLSKYTVVQPGGGEGRLRRWRLIAQEAARQCGRADLPIIDEPCSLQAGLAAAAQDSARFFAWERWDRPAAGPAPSLRRLLTGRESSVALLVGAEGGFAEEEAAAAQQAGFLPVGLGPRILRSETAAIVAVALVQAALGQLD